MTRLVTGVVVALCLASCLTACSGDSGQPQKVTIFAASSLTESFEAMKQRFVSEHPGVDVVLSFGSSSTLAEQVAAGAPADVVATANHDSIQILIEKGLLAAQPTHFADNTLVIVTPPKNPAHIHGLSDLAGTAFVLCDPSAPCGAASQTILNNAGVTAKPKSYEPDVKSVLSRVELHEADAGLVYVTGSRAAGDQVHTIDIPADVNVTNPYYIAAVKDAPHPTLAADWLDLVTSEQGQRLLAGQGFESP